MTAINEYNIDTIAKETTNEYPESSSAKQTSRSDYLYRFGKKENVQDTASTDSPFSS